MSWSSLSKFDNGSKYPKDYPRIYLFGDSLTDRGFYEYDCGFGWKLQQYYADRVEVVNEGLHFKLLEQIVGNPNADVSIGYSG